MDKEIKNNEEEREDNYSPLEDDYAFFEDALKQKKILDSKLDDTIEIKLEDIQ